MIQYNINRIKRSLEIFKTIDNKGRECPDSISEIEKDIEYIEDLLEKGRKVAVYTKAPCP